MDCFRVKPGVHVNAPDEDWIRAGDCYRGEVVKGQRRPPLVRLHHPDEANRWGMISKQHVEKVDATECKQLPE